MTSKEALSKSLFENAFYDFTISSPFSLFVASLNIMGLG